MLSLADTMQALFKDVPSVGTRDMTDGGANHLDKLVMGNGSGFWVLQLQRGVGVVNDDA